MGSTTSWVPSLQFECVIIACCCFLWFSWSTFNHCQRNCSLLNYTFPIYRSCDHVHIFFRIQIFISSNFLSLSKVIYQQRKCQTKISTARSEITTKPHICTCILPTSVMWQFHFVENSTENILKMVAIGFVFT